MKQLFAAAGPDLVRSLQDLGFEIFLDLKFDIVVAQAVRSAANLGVWIVTYIWWCKDDARSAEALSVAHQPLLIAVTV